MRYSLLAICTESRQHQKVVVRHIWKDALEICEDIRHQSGMKERYQHRKETIEQQLKNIITCVIPEKKESPKWKIRLGLLWHV